MRIYKKVYLDIINTLKANRVESGGIIGSKDSQIVAFDFDRACTVGEYVPDVVKLNIIIKKWYESGIEFAGIIHSHMDSKRLSYSDIDYARNIIISNNLKWIYMPIYVNENKELYVYKVSVDNNNTFVEEEYIDVRSK